MLEQTKLIEDNYKDLVKSIKQHEGYSGYQYTDTRGYKTIGYGTKLPLSQKEAKILLEYRLFRMVMELQLKQPFIKELPEPIQLVLYEMSYQLGVNGLLGFEDMLEACEQRDWNNMIKEMKDSKWYKETPHRVNKLISKVKDYMNDNK